MNLCKLTKKTTNGNMNTRLEQHKIEVRKSQFATLSKFEQDKRIVKHYFSLMSAAKDGFFLIEEHEHCGLKDTFATQDLISKIADNIRRAQIEDLGFCIDCKAQELRDKRKRDAEFMLREVIRLGFSKEDIDFYRRELNEQ